MKALYKKKQEILDKVNSGKMSTIKAEQLLKSIEEKENAKIVEK